MNPVKGHGALLGGMIYDMKINLNITSNNFAWGAVFRDLPLTG